MAFVAAPSSAIAATIRVDTTADQAGSRPAECALREAVLAANGDTPVGGCARGSGDDVIILEAGTYLLTRAGSGEDAAIRGDIDVTGELKVLGAGQNRTIITAHDASDRHFEGLQGSSLDLRDMTLDSGSLDEFTGGAVRAGLAAELHLNHVTIRRSVGPGGFAAIGGSSADITVKRSLIERNHADLAGGGIGVSNGSLKIINSRIVNNRSDLFAGGVYPNNADVVIRRSVIEGNRAPQYGGMALLAGTFDISETRVVGNKTEASAGGVYLQSADGTISRSEVSGNVAGADGGGLQMFNGEVSVLASTISGNMAGRFGGGIYIGSSSTELTLNGATVAGNKANADGDGTGNGGGVLVDDGLAIFYNSILGDNSLGGSAGGETECDGGIVAVYTIIEDDCPGLGSNNIIADPGIRPLDDNGGPTLTHALRPSSSAVDAGDPSLPGSQDSSCIPTDQRGLGRPTGECDMGAFELNGF